MPELLMIQQDGAMVTVSGIELLAMTYRAVLQAIARRRRDGLASQELHDLARALRAAHTMSLECRQVDDAADAVADWRVPVGVRLVQRRRGSIPSPTVERPDSAAGRVREARSPPRRQDLRQLRRAPLLVLAKERDARDRARRPDLLGILGAEKRV